MKNFILFSCFLITSEGCVAADMKQGIILSFNVKKLVTLNNVRLIKVVKF